MDGNATSVQDNGKLPADIQNLNGHGSSNCMKNNGEVLDDRLPANSEANGGLDADVSTDATEKGLDTKPRIILTLRTSETDPEAYFSTSSVKVKPGNDKKDSLEIKNTQDSVLMMDTTITESVLNKRNLRRMSNSKESVLQNAIALKEKSFSIPESISVKKNKSPKGNLDKVLRQARLKSPKTHSLFIQDRKPVQNSCNTESFKDVHMMDCVGTDRTHCKLADGELDKNDEDFNARSEIELNGNSVYENSIAMGNENAYSKCSRPTKRRRRYFKGLSYSFSNKRYPKKKRLLSERGRSKYSNYDSSEQDTDSQNTIITSEEMNETGDSTLNESSTESSQISSVLFKSATGIVQNYKHTSLDVINDKFNDEAPSPSTGDSPEKPARPESTLISSGGGTAAVCLCQVQEKVYMKVDATTAYHCQAIDSIEGKLIGCCNRVQAIDNDEIKLQRPSVKVTYLMFCDVHSHRLLIHNCCPTCGLFCTQGKFAMCESRHVYHRRCELLAEDQRLCPHCGQPSPPNDISFSIGQNKNPVFVPLQKSLREIPSAKMSFRGSLTAGTPSEHFVSPPVIPLHSFVLPSGIEITADGLPHSVEKEKLEKYLFGLMPCSSSSPAQRCTYRTMYYAAKSGDVEKIVSCLGSGLNPNHVYRELTMGSALHAASAGGFISVVHVLTQAGAQLDLLDKEQNTSLMLAAINSHNDVVKYLVKAGANVSFKGRDGMTALHLAAQSGNLEACYYLLSNPKSPRDYVNHIDDGGWTALVWAAEHNHVDVVLYLLSKGADPLVRDSEQNIALHWAAFSGSVDISEALLHYHSDINCTNVHGDTPLHICARQEHYPCVILLLAQGARTDIVNAAGRVAMDCCINKPCDTYNVIKLNMQLKEMTAKSRERTSRILTNDITRGHELNPIQCVNAVDDENEPTDFIYIVENCFTSNIKINKTITSLKSCKCTDTCTAASCTCSKLSLRCWYTDDGKLSSDFNFAEPPMLFECNPLCTCNKITCNNRVVQHGITSRFQLFRTKDKGWGVITLRPIPKGSYVCEYIGEIISDTEADTREDDSYLFDLDNKDGETFCIDAFRYGNIARFINHNCVPNLQPVKVFIDHQDLHFPRIAFFSNRDIEPYEELGFDYGEKFWIIKYKSFTCTCGAETCRYSAATIQKTLAAYNRKLQMEDSVS